MGKPDWHDPNLELRPVTRLAKILTVLKYETVATVEPIPGRQAAESNPCIPANLFESELFGAKAGAATDVREDVVGAVERADGGTLFLDVCKSRVLPGNVRCASGKPSRVTTRATTTCTQSLR